MVEEESSEGALRLRQTSVIKPQLEFTSSRQSVAAYEEEYQSSVSAASRPTSNASNAGLLDERRKYSTPPSSPPLLNSDRAARGEPPPADTDTGPVLQPTIPMTSSGAQERNPPPTVTFDDRQIRRKPVTGSSSASSSPSPQRRSYPPPRTSMNRSPPSPGADDTPYIRFALDQLTRDEEVRGSRIYPARDRWSTAPPYSEAVLPISTDLPAPGTYTIPRPSLSPRSAARPTQPIPTNRAGQVPYYDPLAQVGPDPRPTDPGSASKPLPAQPIRNPSGESGYQTPPQEPSTTYRITPVQSRVAQPRDPMTQPDVFVPYDSEVPSLRFLPGILRPLWLSIFIFLCVLMVAAMVFSGVYSTVHHGLWTYTTFGGSRYFVFQYLPVICGIILLLWLFQIQIAVQRISPFIAMASDDYRSRSEGPLMELQPTNFLLPKIFYFRAGLPVLGICMTIFWLQIFTIPLLAAAYNAIYYDQPLLAEWRWTAVQSIVWTLFALYFLLVVALVLLGVWLWRQRTGLKWDPRSLADIIALVDRSNVNRDYEGSETFSSARDFRARLEMRSDRLGYWTSSRRPNDVFYGIGEEGGATRRYSLEAGRLREKGPAEGVSGFYPDTPTTYGGQADLENGDEFEQVRYRYIPWFLRTSSVLLWIVSGILLYLAFLVISFVNNAVVHGFSPLLPVQATAAGFSSTNFLYSFVPALIAQLIFISWLSVDYAFRRLQPYAAMSDFANSGASALDSLLLDYPSRLPFSITVAAVLSKNFRVAWFSFLSLITACLPIFAGGCFWAQWYVPTQEVRVAVNPSAFYALCVFLALLAFSLPLLLFGLHVRHLPHSCTTLADQISFLYGSQILGEREWRAPLGSKTEMTTRLLNPTTPQERAFDGGRFIFGRFVGKDGRTHLGVERVGRDGSKPRWRSRDTTGLLTQPPPVARPAPRAQRTQAGTVVGTGSNVEEGEGFSTLPLVGATVTGAGAATAGAYEYDHGSNQGLLNESEKAEYVRRKEDGAFGSTTTQSAPPPGISAQAADVPSAAPRLVGPVSPIEDDEDDALYAEARAIGTATTASRYDGTTAARHYDYGSKQGLLAESDKPEYVRQLEGGSFGSRATSSNYPSGETTAVSPIATDRAAIVGGVERAGAPAPTGAATGYPVRSTEATVTRASQPTATTTTYPSGSSSYPTPVPPLLHSRTRTSSGTSSILPAVPAAAATTYPYGSAYGSMRDLNASDQAEIVRQREGGIMASGRSTSGASASANRAASGVDTSTTPLLGTDSVDAGQDLPSMLREAAAGRWSFD